MIQVNFEAFLLTIVFFLVGCICGWMYSLLTDKNDDERK